MSSSGSRGLSDLSLRELCRALAARRPTPSGGSLAAGVGALGAAGVSMTLRYAEGEGQAWQQGRGDELEALALRLCDLLERDAAIYDKVVAAKALPPGDPGAPARLERAFRDALETPIEMMEACLGGLRLASAGASLGVPAHLACDCLAGAEALAAALEDAYLMVRENAGFAAGADVGALVAASAAMRAEAARLLAAVRASTERGAR